RPSASRDNAPRIASPSRSAPWVALRRSSLGCACSGLRTARECKDGAMHVGYASIFQASAERSDHEVYRDELRLADLAEPLGFESVWGVEHHFTDYTMCPDVLQFLTYMAGRTSKVQLGSMVVVLPWHDP